MVGRYEVVEHIQVTYIGTYTQTYLYVCLYLGSM